MVVKKKAKRKNALNLKITWKLSKWNLVKRRILLKTETRYPIVKLNLVLSKLKIILYGMF